MRQLQKVFILVKDNIVADAWTSLKLLCEDTRKIDDSFPSYWTLARESKKAKDNEGVIYIESGSKYEYIVYIKDVIRSKRSEG